MRAFGNPAELGTKIGVFLVVSFSFCKRVEGRPGSVPLFRGREAILISSPFLTQFWRISDAFWTFLFIKEDPFWRISDEFLTHFWRISDAFLLLPTPLPKTPLGRYRSWRVGISWDCSVDRQEKEQVVSWGEGWRESRKCLSCSRAASRLDLCKSGVALEQKTFLTLSFGHALVLPQVYWWNLGLVPSNEDPNNCHLSFGNFAPARANMLGDCGILW